MLSVKKDEGNEKKKERERVDEERDDKFLLSFSTPSTTLLN